MRKKTYIYWLIGSFLMIAIAYACKKQKSTGSDPATTRLISAYEEIGRRHNDFLTRSFADIKERISARRVSGILLAAREAAMQEMVLQVSSENLVPVLGGQYTPAQISEAIRRYLPDDLTPQPYASMADCIAAVAPGKLFTQAFLKALRELDGLLSRSQQYSDSVNIINTFDNLLTRHVPALTDGVEKEAFIAGAVVGKYSFRYWAENESRIRELFQPGVPLNGVTKLKPVFADVAGMIKGAVTGGVSGGMWGSLLPGIGTLAGAITGGLVGAAVSGCVGSLATGLWSALF
jgi:hypothetical protein